MAPPASHGRFYILILFALFFFSIRAAFGATTLPTSTTDNTKNFELVTKAKLTELSKEFDDSSSAKIEQSKLEKEWVCDMYGARSRFQAEHGIHLYAFKAIKTQNPKNSESELENKGAHIFKTYKVSEGKNQLVGEKSSLKETIRWTKKGQLLSKLETANNTLIAYSSCKPL